MAEGAKTDTEPMPTGTRLAYERTNIAYERTGLAWTRTGVSLIGFGFAIFKFFEIERLKHFAEPAAKELGHRDFAALLVGAGLVALFIAVAAYRKNVGQLRRECPTLPPPTSPAFAVLIGALGVIALISILRTP